MLLDELAKAPTEVSWARLKELFLLKTILRKAMEAEPAEAGRGSKLAFDKLWLRCFLIVKLFENNSKIYIMAG